MHLVVMGVAGSGKTTIATELAKLLGADFIEGDELHSAANVAKMTAGQPLDDIDRIPWLDACGSELSAKPRAVLACSALKRKYRDRITGLAPDAIFIHLDGSQQVLMERLIGRNSHFMKPQMLESQLSALERLGEDEKGFALDIDASEADIVEAAINQLARNHNLKVSL